VHGTSESGDLDESSFNVGEPQDGHFRDATRVEKAERAHRERTKESVARLTEAILRDSEARQEYLMQREVTYQKFEALFLQLKTKHEKTLEEKEAMHHHNRMLKEQLARSSAIEMSLKGQVSLLEEEVLQLQERLTKLELGS
jgi:hypothetical protein